MQPQKRELHAPSEIRQNTCIAYSTKDSRVVTHHSTNLAIRSLTEGDRTGSRMFFNLWPYVTTRQ
ncbi:hypothetical protein BJ508DRAFT_345846 [Ascobolus immersus RN42]|uniref:Uncharacterized protein n=1 Tax=Ascobolus immersus RN42 TaxID=1160509 RepID=A0A3N4I622_ASCIM|nr:hypothetical protein BJ508DRAFT_345846 [Ascobolus immersus RN42]